MKLREAYTKFDFEDVSILIVDTNGKSVAVSEANSSGGYCACCCDGSITDNCSVIRVVDLKAMEVLYDCNYK